MNSRFILIVQMDTSVNPQISYGVIFPYTQNLLSEEGTWSEDGKIYTVTHEVKYWCCRRDQ